MKKRIQFVCVSLRSGGTERIVARYANHLCNSADVSIVTLAKSEAFYSLDPRILVRQPAYRKRSGLGLKWIIQVLAHLRRSSKNFEPDLVLAFGEDIIPFAIISSYFSGLSCLLFLRASPLHILSGWRGLIFPVFKKGSSRLIVQTRKSREVLATRWPRLEATVLPNPIEIPETVVSFEERHRQVVQVGTLGGRKGQAELISSFAKSGVSKDWRLVFVGDGPDRSRLERLVIDLGVADRVDFLGWIEDVQSILQHSRVFAFPSRREGFPNALAEALAAGCACISYDCLAGPSDMIEHETNGLLVPDGKQEIFARELARLTGDDDLQTKFSNAARVSIKRFSSDSVFESLNSILEHSFKVRVKRG